MWKARTPARIEPRDVFGSQPSPGHDHPRDPRVGAGPLQEFIESVLDPAGRTCGEHLVETRQGGQVLPRVVEVQTVVDGPVEGPGEVAVGDERVAHLEVDARVAVQEPQHHPVGAIVQVGGDQSPEPDEFAPVGAEPGSQPHHGADLD